jgi:RNA polymerase sigma factor (sigma-70 family)
MECAISRKEHIMREEYDKDASFIRLYDTHRESLRRYLRTLGVVENQDDIVQEAYMRLYYRMDSMSQPFESKKLLSYLYTIARNIVYDKHRHDRRFSNLKAEVDDTLLQSIPDKTPLPEKVYEEKELLEDLKQAIEKLPEKLAEALKGLLEGKSFEIVAHDIGIQVPALKYRLRKAKDLLGDGW